MKAIFEEVGFKSYAGGDALLHRRPPVTKHPRTQQAVAPRVLGGEPLDDTGRRRQLADWLTSADNPWFARNLANRMWARMLGRGLVEPVDDFRLTNPPSHPELLQHLADELRQSGYDAKQLLRQIALSETYQRSSTPTPSNQADPFNYSRYPLKSIPAEVVLDAICQVTDVPEKFDGLPAGSRAIELWDSHVPHYFLRLFGRPQRETACECARVGEPNVSQVLHLLNSPALHEKVGHANGRVRRLSDATADDSRVVEQLYLVALNRYPTAAEQSAVVRHIQSRSQLAGGEVGDRDLDALRRRAIEDVAWSLMNTLEFVLNH